MTHFGGSREPVDLKYLGDFLSGDQLRIFLSHPSASISTRPPILEGENAGLEELTQTVYWLNDSIELCAITLSHIYGMQYLGHALRNSILTRFPHRLDASLTDFVEFGIGRDVMGVDVMMPCLQSLFNVALVKTIFDPFAPGLDADINEQLLSMYSRISLNGMSFLVSDLHWG
jgi:hypothetical protein